MIRTTALWKKQLLLAAVIGLAAGGCKKRRGAADDLDGATGRAAQDIGVRLSVVSVSPAAVPADQPIDITVRGSGFAHGAQVFVGTQEAGSVTFQSSSALQARLSPMPVGRYDVEVQQDGQSSVLRQGLTVGTGVPPECDRVTVHFDLNQDTLRGDGASTLTSRLNCYTDSAGTIIIEGHADERGTTDYNLALGERRANAVSSWLTSRGVARTRIDTISYGEERPVDPGHNEAAWAKNRRAEIMLRP